MWGRLVSVCACYKCCCLYGCFALPRLVCCLRTPLCSALGSVRGEIIKECFYIITQWGRGWNMVYVVQGCLFIRYLVT